MGLTIIKNTIPRGIRKDLNKTGNDMVLAVERGLEVIRSTTLSFTPVKTGRLKGSLASKASKDSIYRINQERKNGDIQRVIGVFGTNVEYAKYVEFGTSRMKGRYYLTQGLQASRDDLNRVILNTLKK